MMILRSEQMLKCIVLGVFVLGSAIAMDFKSIVSDNAGNPQQIITQLRAIENSDALAKAFVTTFGGENYLPITQEERQRLYSEEIEDALKDAALIVGSEMRKIGAAEVDNEANLKVSKRFLEFAAQGGRHSFIDEDVDLAFEQDQLEDMIRNRREYRLAIESLKGMSRTTYEKRQIPLDVLREL